MTFSGVFPLYVLYIMWVPKCLNYNTSMVNGVLTTWYNMVGLVLVNHYTTRLKSQVFS